MYPQQNLLLKTMQGERKFESIAEAHLITGFDTKGISHAAKGLHKGFWRGYKWAFEKAKNK